MLQTTVLFEIAIEDFFYKPVVSQPYAVQETLSTCTYRK